MKILICYVVNGKPWRKYLTINGALTEESLELAISELNHTADITSVTRLDDFTPCRAD